MRVERGTQFILLEDYVLRLEQPLERFGGCFVFTMTVCEVSHVDEARGIVNWNPVSMNAHYRADVELLRRNGVAEQDCCNFFLTEEVSEHIMEGRMITFVRPVSGERANAES
jgi:hypothetical protein